MDDSLGMTDEDHPALQPAEQDDSIAQFLEHTDSVMAVDHLNKAPFNLFVSGCGADKCYVWKLEESPAEENMNDEAKDELIPKLRMEDSFSLPKIIH